jgi:hypothetical protein
LRNLRRVSESVILIENDLEVPGLFVDSEFSILGSTISGPWRELGRELDIFIGGRENCPSTVMRLASLT